MLTSKEAKNNANNHSLQACQSGTGRSKIQFTTQTYNIAKNTRNLRKQGHIHVLMDLQSFHPQVVFNRYIPIKTTLVCE